MKYDLRRLAGWLLLLGTLQFFLSMSIAESLYPNYSRANNYISDLGVGSTALLFNASIVLAALAALFAAYATFRIYKNAICSILLAFSSIGIAGVGIFPETAGDLHVISSAAAFIFGALAAIASSKIAKRISYLCIFLGALSLVATLLFESNITLGLGIGGMERAIVYPFLLWALLFGAHLIRE